MPGAQLQFEQLDARLQQLTPVFGVPACTTSTSVVFIAHARVWTSPGKRFKEARPFPPRHEIGGNQIQLPADAADDFAELRHHQPIARRLAQPFRRIVSHQLYLGEFRLDGAIAKAHRAGFQLHRQFAGPAAFGRGGLRRRQKDCLCPG